MQTTNVFVMFMSKLSTTIVLLSLIAHRELRVGADVEVTPLWDDDVTSDSPCDLTMDNGLSKFNATVFNGGENKTCSVEVETSSDETGIKIQIPDETPTDTVVYVEKQGDLLGCQTRYFDITTNQACATVFSHAKLRLFLQGNTSVLISDTPISESSSVCPENDDASSGIPQQSLCFRDEFKRTVSCSGLENRICQLQLRPPCNATLSSRRVDFICSDVGEVDDDTNDSDEGDDDNSVMIVYSDDVATLNISYQNVKKISANTFRHLKYLDRLDISHNVLSDVHQRAFNGLSNLRKLDLQNNTLENLPEQSFRGLSSLTHLHLDANYLSLLWPNLFSGLNNLEVLVLHDNYINTLHADHFRPLRNLANLSLSFNILLSLPNGLFSENTNLVELELQGNFLQTLSGGVFSGLTNLMRLSLYVNRLTSLDEDVFHANTNLVHLTLSYNLLRSLPGELFEGLVDLKELHLDVNQITSLDEDLFSDTSKLTNLYMDRNRLGEIPVKLFDSLHDLKFLTIQNNPFLTTFPSALFQQLSSLDIAMLANNLLSELSYDAFWNLGNLTTLTLHSNRIEDLDRDIFKDLRKLQVLFMAYNLLSHVDDELFEHLVSLRHLELSHNHLTGIPDMNTLRQLKHIGLIGNPLMEVEKESFRGISAEVVVDQPVICECYVPRSSNCSSLGWRSPFLTCDRILSNRAVMVLMWLIGVNALIGNLFVLVRKKSKSEKHTVQSVLLSNLAASDFLMGIYMISLAFADIRFGEHFPMRAEIWRSSIICRIIGAIAITSSEASVFFVTLISIDRFINIRFSQAGRKLEKKSAIGTVSLLWVVSLVLGIVPSALAGYTYRFYDKSHVCIGLPLAQYGTYSKWVSFDVVHKEAYSYTHYVVRTMHHGNVPGLFYSSALFIGLNGLCVLTVLLCYLEIVRYVRKTTKSAGVNQDLKEQIGMTLEVTAVVITDFFCWSPIILMGIFVQLGLLVLPPAAYAVSVSVILPLNSALNPYLYTVATIISNRRKKVDAWDQTEMRSMSETQYKGDAWDQTDIKSVKSMSETQKGDAWEQTDIKSVKSVSETQKVEAWEQAEVKFSSETEKA